MDNPLRFSGNQPTIGFVARRSPDGPERDLVQEFAAWAATRFGIRSRRVAIFFEPAVETRFPDIVISVFDPRRFETWREERNQLSVADLRLLHHLYRASKIELPQTSAQLSVPLKQLTQRIERLHDAGLARKAGSCWRPVALSDVFGIKRLIAIEAKISDWRTAIEQASANRWFASETNVLTPTSQPHSRLLEKSAALGVGIYASSRNRIMEITTAAKLPLPSSYASWLFNEWIGRSMSHDERIYTEHGHVDA